MWTRWFDSSLHSLTQIREENPRLARDSKILRVTMDNVFEVFTTPREETGLQVQCSKEITPDISVEDVFETP